MNQEAFNEEIKGLNAPVTRHLEELNRLVQGLLTTLHPNDYTDYSTVSGTAAHQPNMVTGATRNRNRQPPTTSQDTNDKVSYIEYDRRFRQPTTPEMADPYEHLLDTITTLPCGIQTSNPRLLKNRGATFISSDPTVLHIRLCFYDCFNSTSFFAQTIKAASTDCRAI